MKRKNSEATLQISDARVYAHTPKSYKNYLLHVRFNDLQFSFAPNIPHFSLMYIRLKSLFLY